MSYKRRWVYEIILNRILYIRNEQKLSQYQLAMLSNLSRSTISDLENGRHIPSQLSIRSVSKALNLKCCQVFLLDDEYLEL